MENEDPETEDRILKWIAGSMGFELHYEAEYDRDGAVEPSRWWFMLKPLRGTEGWKITMSFYTQKKLLDHILGSKTAFLDGGAILYNPFYGKSMEELELRMAAAGV